MLSKMYKGSMSAGGAISLQLTNDFVDGLVIITNRKLKATDKLTVQVRGKNRSDVLANDLPMDFLAELSDIRYGLGQGMAELGTIDVTAIGYAVRVDLGELDLHDKTLEIQVQMTDACSILGVYAEITTTGNHRPLAYRMTQDQNAVFPNTEMLLGYKATGFELTTAGSVTVKADGSTTITDVPGLIARTVLDGRIEYKNSLLVTTLFENMDDIPDDVHVNAEGFTGLNICHVETILSSVEVSKAMKISAEKEVAKAAKLETSKPTVARALRRSGSLPGKARDMNKVAAAMTVK